MPVCSISQYQPSARLIQPIFQGQDGFGDSVSQIVSVERERASTRAESVVWLEKKRCEGEAQDLICEFHEILQRFNRRLSLQTVLVRSFQFRHRHDLRERRSSDGVIQLFDTLIRWCGGRPLPAVAFTYACLSCLRRSHLFPGLSDKADRRVLLWRHIQHRRLYHICQLMVGQGKEDAKHNRMMGKRQRTLHRLISACGVWRVALHPQCLA